MSVNRLYYPVFVLCVLLSTNLAICEEFVPVYLWETAKTDEVVPALPRINRETFKEIIKERLANNPVVVVFAEPSLSPEDFSEVDSSGQKSFPLLADVSSFARVTYLSSVEDPVAVIKHLHGVELTQVKLKDFLNNPILPSSRVLFIDLNDLQDDEDRINMLRRHDSSIIEVYNLLLKEHKNVLAVLTSHHTSWIIPEDVSKGRRSRNILEDAAEGDERRLYQTENFLLYVNSTATVSNSRTIFNLSEHTVSQTNVTNGTLVVDLTSADSVDVRFSFTLISSTWTLQEVTVTDKENGSNVFNLVPRSISAPQRFSYQCTSQVFYERNNRERNMSLPGMQIQPFVSGLNVSFGDPYFCVGFTTVPIWSGLFVVAILVTIMAIGLSMMMDIRTMDRFDDPKGKTIIINVSE